MPVAVNVPVALVDVDELDPLSPQETKMNPIQVNNVIDKIFFMCKFRFKFRLMMPNLLDGNYQQNTDI